MSDILAEHCPGWTTLPFSFKGCMPYIVASLAHHHAWLKENLPRNHPFTLTSLWTSGALRDLKDKVLLGNGTCEVTGMRASGLPPHILHAVQLQRMEKTAEARTGELLAIVCQGKFVKKVCRIFEHRVHEK